LHATCRIIGRATHCGVDVAVPAMPLKSEESLRGSRQDGVRRLDRYNIVERRRMETKGRTTL